MINRLLSFSKKTVYLIHKILGKYMVMVVKYHKYNLSILNIALKKVKEINNKTRV